MQPLNPSTPIHRKLGLGLLLAVWLAASLLPGLALPGALAQSPACAEAILHYRRPQADYDGWGLHVWGPTAEQGVTWGTPLAPDGQDDYGIYWNVAMQPGADRLNYIVHKGDQKDPGPDQSLVFAATGCETWLIQGSGEQFSDPQQALKASETARFGDFKNKAQAHWLTRQYLAWPIEYGPTAAYRLHYSPDGALQATPQGISGGEAITLEYAAGALTGELAGRFPHLKDARLLRLPAEALGLAPQILKGQFAVSVTSARGELLRVAGVQIPGVLDDLYANDEPLGVVLRNGVPTLRVWAPTARSVILELYADARPQTAPELLAMAYDPQTGIWELAGRPEWLGRYYRYNVEVFVRSEGRFVRNQVTDPYSLSLSMNSARSQIVDLDDPALKPAGWNALVKPALEAPEDIVLYELHIRDFSAFDLGLPTEQRGTYLAFANPGSAGRRHLQRLAQAGVTHVHLLPAFDIATIDEDKSTWVTPDYAALSSLPPDSEQQQALLAEARGRDGYNWGYDPFHYTTPEGSYSSDPDGAARILQFRQMMQAINQAGLRVVMDVVYNHTNAAGQSARSVLDRIVPGYYHRLDADGNVASSTCCANTASEHAMMEKLMVDSLLTWARQYRVDGFRFDLMGHHMRANMLTVRAALDELTLGQDGVDGKSIYIYGEGWDFGEVAGNARGVNATQLNLAGSGIGTFNDRLRDAARGGNPFGGLQEQGFASGLYTYPNQVSGLTPEAARSRLLELTDQVMVSLAGNLADYRLVNGRGREVRGAAVNYNGAPAGYTQDPQENIVYVEAHDNETLWDALAYKAPEQATLEERVRMQNMALSLTALSQGVPFFHAGSELLRSKSLDRDSYDSGDWFNRLDFTYQTNNWGAGLPPQDKNGANWPLMAELLGQPGLRPGPQHIQAALAHFEEMLAIRRSSPLFRLRTAAQVNQRLRFHNTGPSQVPGLIVMSLSDNNAVQLDPDYDLVVVLFNAGKDAVRFPLAELVDPQLSLHPVQAASRDPLARAARFDAASRTFEVPGLTTAVFVGKGRIKGVQEGLPMWPWLLSAGGLALLAVAIWLYRRAKSEK
jgi:pullulanase-type alpha-1,6-glucosidase